VETDKLVRRTQRGDKKAFAELIKFYQQDIFRFVCRRIFDYNKAEDITSEVFAEIWWSIKSLKSPVKFKFWLFRIAWNISAEYIVKSSKVKTYEKSLEKEMIEELPDNELQEIAELVSTNEMKEKLWECLNKLPDVEKEILILYYFKGNKYNEIGKILGCPESTIKTRSETAKQGLLHCLKNKGVNSNGM